MVIGLASDNVEINRDGRQLWHLFNTGWLAVLQEQYESSLLRPLPNNLLLFSELRYMSRRLIRLVDALEGTGLQATGDGVWEDNILASEFAGCLPVLFVF